MTIKLFAASLSAACLATGGIASAQPQAAQLAGWWRATLTHEGEQEDFYLNISDKDGKASAAFSIPAISADQSPIGPVKVGPGRVDFPAAGWALELDGDARTLTGTLPSAVVPVYPLHARFVRSPAPPAPPIVTPAEEAPRPLWKARLESPIYGGLAYNRRDGMVVVAADDGRIAALDVRTGRTRWSRALGSAIRSTPVVVGGSLYVAADREFAKLDAASARLLWATPLGAGAKPRLPIDDPQSRWSHFGSSPVIAKGLAIVGSRDGCVHAFDARTGRARHRICSKDEITAAPVVIGDNVYFGSFDHHVYAANLRTGRALWTADMKEPVTSDLLRVGDAILAGSRSYDLSALHLGTGKRLWNRYVWFSWIDASPVLEGQLLVIGSSDAQRIFAMDAADGRVRWKSFIGGWAWARPAIGERTIYAGAVGTSMHYVGRREGALAAIDRTNGHVTWLFKPPHDPKAVMSGFAAAPVLADDTLIAADLEGNVYAFAAD